MATGTVQPPGDLGPSAGGAASGAPAGSGPAGPVRGRRAHSAAIEVGVVAAVAVVVLVALLWSGLLGSSAGAPSLSIPYSDARSLAEASAEPYLPAGPLVLAAFGLDLRTATTVSEANLSSLIGDNCSLSPVLAGGLTSSLVVPAYGGAWSAGVAPFWAVLLGESPGDTVLLVLVLNATAEPVATVSGSACLSGDAASSALPSDTADSPTAAADAWSYAGQSWSNARGSTVDAVVMAAVDGGSYDGLTYSASWLTGYLPCDPLIVGSVATPAELVLASLTTGSPQLSLTHDVDCAG